MHIIDRGTGGKPLEGTYQQEDKKRHLNIKEASALYNVSRSKLHNLISQGHLHTEPDPRDGRARLISSKELEELFGLTEPMEESDATEGYNATGGYTTGDYTTGDYTTGDHTSGGYTTGDHTSGGDTMYKSAYTTGRLTSSARGHLDALRRRVAMSGKKATDSVEIIRELRAERSGSPYA